MCIRDRYRTGRQSSGRRSRKLQDGTDPQSDSDEHRSAEDQIHEYRRIQSSDNSDPVSYTHLRVDRGAEFKGKEFDRLCIELGIEKQIVPGAMGSLKGVVEQSFHRLQSEQREHIENHGLIEKRYDSHHHKEASLNIRQYTAMVINYVLNHNQTYNEYYLSLIHI